MENKNLTDEELVLRFQGGDSSAYEVLVRRYRDKIIHFIVNKYIIDGKEHTPTTISSLILKKIKEDVELYSSSEIASAVITVPANFGNNQREETLKAAKIAGLNVDYIVNEPTAAALTYAKLKGGAEDGYYIICW